MYECAYIWNAWLGSKSVDIGPLAQSVRAVFGRQWPPGPIAGLMSHHLPTGWFGDPQPCTTKAQSLQSLGKGNSPIQSFNCLFVRMIWTSEAKSRANFAQAHAEAQLSWAERFCLKSASHKPCSSILTCPMCFVPIFSVLFLQYDRKSSGPHQNVRNDGLREQALWKHSFSVYWHIFPGCMLHVFSAGISYATWMSEG